MNAAAANDLARVRALIKQGANINQRGAGGETALYEAIERRNPSSDNLPVVAFLLKAGADPNGVGPYNMTPLQLSLTRTFLNPEVVRLLVESGARVPTTCEPGNDSLLSYATQDSNLDSMRLLIANHAAVNCQYQGHTALYWAALNGQADRVEVLLQGGADPRITYDSGKTILQIATTTNPEARVQAQFAATRELLTNALNKQKAKP